MSVLRVFVDKCTAFLSNLTSDEIKAHVNEGGLNPVHMLDRLHRYPDG
jgi:hypothetical protein